MWKASLLSDIVERLYDITALETLRYVFIRTYCIGDFVVRYIFGNRCIGDSVVVTL